MLYGVRLIVYSRYIYFISLRESFMSNTVFITSATSGLVKEFIELFATDGNGLFWWDGMQKNCEFMNKLKERAKFIPLLTIPVWVVKVPFSNGTLEQDISMISVQARSVLIVLMRI